MDPRVVPPSYYVIHSIREAVGVMVDDVAMVDIQTKVQHPEDK